MYLAERSDSRDVWDGVCSTRGNAMSGRLTEESSASDVHGLARPLFAVSAAGVLGVLSGTFAAHSYYDDLLRLFAHALTPWVLFAVAASARRSARWGALCTITGFVGAVSAFYLGKPVFYGLHYPDVPALPVDFDGLFLWAGFAVASGFVLGGVFSRVGERSWDGAASTAAAIALLIASTTVETHLDLHRDSLALLAFCLCAVAVVGFLADTTIGQIKRTAALTVPFVVVALVLVAVPDLVERILL